MIPVLYDGWPLLHFPESPEALHLLAILALSPSEVQLLVAFPDSPPAWLPENAQPCIHHAPDTLWGRFFWEQFWLPRLTRKLGASLLHLTSPFPPLFSPVPVLLSPAGYTSNPLNTQASFTRQKLPFADRLRQSFARGGFTSLAAILWPTDLPTPVSTPRLIPLPPIVHPGFTSTSNATFPGLPETYILYHGPAEQSDLRRLLDAWSWASASIGATHPLLLLGLSEEARVGLEPLLAEYDLGDTVRPLPQLNPLQVPSVYRQCAALFHPAPISPWAGSLQHALACGLPIVAAENPLSDALVGPAGYLVKGGDPRALAAALITVVIEEHISTSLSALANKRTSGWSSLDFSLALLQVYRVIASRR